MQCLIHTEFARAVLAEKLRAASTSGSSTEVAPDADGAQPRRCAGSRAVLAGLAIAGALIIGLAGWIPIATLAAGVIVKT